MERQHLFISFINLNSCGSHEHQSLYRSMATGREVQSRVSAEQQVLIEQGKEEDRGNEERSEGRKWCSGRWTLMELLSVLV